jgi:hypothetical protein
MLAPLLLSSLPQARAQDVERSELPPLPGAAPPDLGERTPSQPAPDFPAPSSLVPRTSGTGSAGSALPADLWQGVDAEALQRLVASVPLPSPSPTLAGLTARALATGPGGNVPDLAVKAAALENAGRPEEIILLLGGAHGPDVPGLAVVYALALFAAGRETEACAVELGAPFPVAQSEAARAAALVPAYCAAARGDSSAAVEALLREGRAQASKSLPRNSTHRPTFDVVDYLSLKLDAILKLGGPGIGPNLAAQATPKLLFLLAHDETAPPELRLAAAERAAGLNVIAGEDLARAYREASAKLPKAAQSGPALRARLFAAFESAPSTNIRAESIAALLASARDQGIEVPVAQALAQASAGLVEDPQADFFAETGVRIAALAGDEASAWAWIDAGGERMRSWQLLLAASDPQGPRAEAALGAGIDIALKGGLPPPLLHRLVTVLDALDYEVPIPLWDEASKTPQPTDGDLPETGALTSLKQAADAGEVGRTLLIAAAVLGPNGAKGAHLIALGDALRALKRVGLDAEARRLGFEALYAHWPSHGKA